MEVLEKEVQKMDWKQWLPVFGLGKAIIDHIYEKPSLLDLDDHPMRAILSSCYHTLVTHLPIFYAIYQTLNHYS